jgi:hypothetical protein
VHVAHRSFVGLHSLRVDELEHQHILAVAEPGDGLLAGWIVGGPLRQLDAARLEEGAHAVRAGLAVDVSVVVLDGVEGAERLAGPFGALAQVLVEHLLPRRRVDLGGLGEHAVEIEQASGDGVGEAEH